jgi:FkbM family methyltransferase
MMLGGRSVGTVLRALGEPRHYLAFGRMLARAESPARLLWMYLTSQGRYPQRVVIRTPLGNVGPMLFSSHDLLTVNEIFFRRDYPVPRATRTVVDLGSNIGLSALYFLTRSRDIRCYLFEPVPVNVVRLRRNLHGFEERWTVTECAVSDFNGPAQFGIEETGRYGGIERPAEDTINVACRHVGDVVEEILRREGRVDILKIDTEGAETRTLAALTREHTRRIGRVYVETHPGATVGLDGFSARRQGQVWQLLNAHLAGTSPR